jgi:hypothetical protein
MGQERNRQANHCCDAPCAGSRSAILSRTSSTPGMPHAPSDCSGAPLRANSLHWRGYTAMSWNRTDEW